MALVKNTQGQWAWVDAPGEKPAQYHETKDAAIEASKSRGKSVTTDSVGDRKDAVRTAERGEWH